MASLARVLAALLLLLTPALAARTLQDQAAPGGSTNSSLGGNATAAVAPGSGQVFTGDGTAFSEAVPNSGKNFACSYRYLNDWASVHFAAINAPQWADGDSCGRCATVRCVDSRCPTQNKDVTVMIVDKCPECKEGDLDFSIPVYRDITGSWPNRLQVSWQWADCAPYINGTIKMAPKDGVNAFWSAYYFSNFKHAIKSITLDGKPLERNEFQFWSNPSPLGDAPHKFEFEATNGMRVTAFSDDPLKEQDLGVNFGS